MERTDRCALCGGPMPAQAAFCPACGWEAEDPSPSLVGMLLGNVREIFESLLNPLFAYMKTWWLATFRPVAFHRTRQNRARPIAQIGFPLQFLWRWLFPDVHPYVLDPLEFLLTPVVLALVLGVTPQIESAFAASAETVASMQSQVPWLNPVTEQEINFIADMSVNALALMLVLTLLFGILMAAAVYRLWLGWGNGGRAWTPRVYRYWFYSAGALAPVVLFGRFYPFARGWAESPGPLRWWIPVGTGVFLLLAVWLLGIAPFWVFRDAGVVRVAGAVVMGWWWWAMAYVLWRVVGQVVLGYLLAFVMLVLLLLALLPASVWLCLSVPLFLAFILALGLYRAWQRSR